MNKCPYCGGKLTGEKVLPVLPRRQRRIYDAVVAGSNNGVPADELLKIMYSDDTITPSARGVLRVQVYELNKKIAPIGQRIKGGWATGYRLITL